MSRFLATMMMLALVLARPAHAETAASPAKAATAEIETVGFYSKVRMGLGGIILPMPTPVVLFRNGDALKAISELNRAGGPAASKKAEPDEWTTWRRNGGTVEMLDAEGWAELPFTNFMGPLPRGHRLAAKFRSLSGGGNVATGGNAMIAVWAEFTFDNAGRFTTGGGAGASVKVEGPSSTTETTTTAKAAQTQGTYEIDGYTLTLHYDDGRTEARMIVMDLSDPKSVLWLDGDGYVRR